jgi:CheY-like chemotaxis protein
MGKKNWSSWLNECKQFLVHCFFSKKQESPQVSPPPVVVDAKELKTIVVVEDNALLRKRYVDILTSFHFDVVEANNNAEAIHFFKTVEKEVHLLITNIERNDGNSFELLSNLHTYLPYYIPVFLISAQLEHYKEEINEAENYKGVKSLFTRPKPLTVDLFLRGVRGSMSSPIPWFPTSSYLTQLEKANTMKKNDFPVIMLVDDELSMIRLYEKMLFGLPYNVFTFKEGYSALEFLGSSPIQIDLIITNIKMPLVDGYDLLRRTYEFIDYPILALVITALFSPDLKHNYMSRNYELVTLVDVLPKPIDYFTFHQAICNALPIKASSWMN